MKDEDKGLGVAVGVLAGTGPPEMDEVHVPSESRTWNGKSTESFITTQAHGLITARFEEAAVPAR